jgi:VanZ family protein
VPAHHCVGPWFDQRSSSIRDLIVPLGALVVGIVVWVVVRRRLLARR